MMEEEGRGWCTIHVFMQGLSLPLRSHGNCINLFTQVSFHTRVSLHWHDVLWKIDKPAEWFQILQNKQVLPWLLILNLHIYILMQAVELLAYSQYFTHFLVTMETSECRRTVFMKLNVYKTNKQLNYKNNRSNNDYYLNSISFQRVKMGLIHSILPWTREGRVEVCVLGCTQGGHHPTSNSLHWLHVSKSSSSSSEFSEKFTCHNNRIPLQQREKKNSDCLSHKSPICPVHVAGKNRWTCNTTGQHADFKSYRVQKYQEAKIGTFKQKFFCIPELGCKICRGLARKTFPSQSSYFYLSLPNALQK